MKLLEEKIVREGVVYPGKILKVGSFLNHQVDVVFMRKIAEEFYDIFRGEPVTKILTVETSGIAVGYPVAECFGVPLLFGKKNRTKNLSDDCYCAKVTSYTHAVTYDVVIEKAFQDGGKLLRLKGIRVESLARIADMNPETGITFVS